MLRRLRCESVERKDKVVECRTIFGGSPAEIGGWMEECREDGRCEKCFEGE